MNFYNNEMLGVGYSAQVFFRKIKIHFQRKKEKQIYITDDLEITFNDSDLEAFDEEASDEVVFDVDI